MSVEINIQVGQKIAALRQSLSETQAVFGERFGVEQGTVSRWERGFPVARQYQAKLADLAGMSVAQFFHSPDQPRLVPVVAHADGETFRVESPAPGSTVEHFKLEPENGEQASLRVVGRGLEPAFHDGDLLVGRRLRGPQIEQAIGKECMALCVNGIGYLRVLRPGSRPGLYTLRSLDPKADDITDVELVWAAPIRLIVRD